jgi:hypothetical protein
MLVPPVNSVAFAAWRRLPSRRRTAIARCRDQALGQRASQQVCVDRYDPNEWAGERRTRGDLSRD